MLTCNRELKRSITEALVLISLDFSPGALPIILNVDAATTIRWGAILSQMPSGEKTETCAVRNQDLEWGRAQVRCVVFGVPRITEGIEKAAVLALWTTFLCGNTRTNASLATQPTSKRS